MGALGIVELQRVGDRIEDAVGDAAGAAALEALVVLDADAGQRGDLLAPKTGHLAPAEVRQAGLLRRHPRAPRDRPGSTPLTLNNGVELPALGLGVFQTPPDETRDAVRASGVDRSDVFLETKIWISDYGYDETLHACDKSAGKLGVDQIDLLILHQALPSAFDRTLEAYRALEKLLEDGKVRAIGVSNFMVDHLTALLDRAVVVPAVNQIEVHPYFIQPEVQAFGAEHGILTQAWSPIGGITFYRDGEHTSTLQDPVIGDIAQAHRKTPAQVMLRWGIQHGRSVIPKSTKRDRIAENIDVFDFELSSDQLAAIDALDTGRRGGPEPEAITLEAFGREIPEA